MSEWLRTAHTGSGGSVQPAGIQQALLVIHILLSLGGSPPASTFLLLSNSGTAWDQWFLLLRFLSVLAVNPGPPGDQRALGHHPLQLDTHQRCPCPRMGEQRRLVQCQLCPHPSHAWAGGAGPFSSHSVPPQTRSSPCSGGNSGGPQVGNGEQARSEVLTRVPLVPLRIPSWLKVLW